MRQLRFVKPGEAPDHLVLETADGGEQLLTVDTTLRDAVRSDLPRVPVAASPDQPATIGPREIQMRVRAGESPQALAEQNAMTLEKVMRFAGPVVAERARIADEARRARARRSTTEGQTVVFGEAVDERFAAHGIDASDVGWDAHRRDDGEWVIGARWLGGDADRLAQWIFHRGTRTVTPLDDTAADLLSDRPIRAVLPPDRRPVLTAAPPLAPGVVAFPAMPDAHTGKLPQLDEVFDQEAVDRDRPRRPEPVPVAAHRARVPSAPSPAPEPAAPSIVAPTTATASATTATPTTPTPRAEVDDYDTPLLPLRLAEPTVGSEPEPAPRVTNLGVATRAEESEEQRAERSRIPSWDDIMLGVRRKTD